MICYKLIIKVKYRIHISFLTEQQFVLRNNVIISIKTQLPWTYYVILPISSARYEMHLSRYNSNALSRAPRVATHCDTRWPNCSASLSLRPTNLIFGHVDSLGATLPESRTNRVLV